MALDDVAGPPGSEEALNFFWGSLLANANSHGDNDCQGCNTAKDVVFPEHLFYDSKYCRALGMSSRPALYTVYDHHFSERKLRHNKMKRLAQGQRARPAWTCGLKSHLPDCREYAFLMLSV